MKKANEISKPNGFVRREIAIYVVEISVTRIVYLRRTPSGGFAGRGFLFAEKWDCKNLIPESKSLSSLEKINSEFL